MIEQLFTPAQCLGYVALVLGVTAFLQRSDQHLRFLSACQGLTYAIHFAMLGNAAAAASSAVSSTRSFLSIRYRSPWLVVLFVAIAIGFGLLFAREPYNWLPVAGSAISTVAIFLTSGITLRLLILSSTALWLMNNILSGSVGGVVLEIFIGSANLTTIVRMARSQRKQPSAEGAIAGRVDMRDRDDAPR